MFKFDENSSEPRRKQFWDKFANTWAWAYAGSTTATSLAYQVGLTNEHTFILTNTVSFYSFSGMFLLAAVGTTVARNFRPDFDTWWTQSPQYQKINTNYSLNFEDEEKQPFA